MNGINTFSPTAPLQQNTREPLSSRSEVAKSSESFRDVLSTMVNNVNESQQAGDKAIKKLQAGDADHLHDVMIKVEEADVSLRMLVQVRNKAQAAYEEIMRMQI
ncbi:MAG: flagellar hook-basal body complex protein FliE [Desulfobacterales bacterium]|nr:MAG: flagellar hook-basal body complex protein FliE [Desulfobacterales bacterium]